MKTRQWILERRPRGHDYQGALVLHDEVSLPELQEGQILARARWLSIDAGTRMWLTAREDAYQPPVPLGAPMAGMQIGEVVDSAHTDFRAGDRVRGFGQWADLSVLDPSLGWVERCPDVDVPEPAFLALLGPNGWTAHEGMIGVARVGPDDVAVVSASAGATGSLAGQMARIQGARVIGICGDDAKGAWTVDELGFDASINYRTEDVAARLRELAPDGVDVYFDNVGGETLDAVMGHLAMNARIAISGLLSSYTEDRGSPGPSNFDQILMKRAQVTGVFSPDFFHRGAAMDADIARWYANGEITYGLTEVEGLENATQALAKMFAGGNRGKLMVRL